MLLNNMKQTLKQNFYGDKADFFKNGFVKIVEIKELDRERAAVEITFEVKEE